MTKHKDLIALTVLLVVGSFALPSQAVAKEQCHKINTELTSDADLATFTTKGVIKSGLLKGKTEFSGTLVSGAPIDSQPPLLHPTFSYTGKLEITTKHGSLTTHSAGLFELAPFGLGTQFDRVVTGTGKFKGATGFLFFDFQANADVDGFASIVTGVICMPK